MAKKHLDLSQLAKSIVDKATTDSEDTENTVPGKNPAAVALGRLGGLKGGKARAQSLTAERRKEIAQKAINKRWGKE
jgi:hypothetical protein